MTLRKKKKLNAPSRSAGCRKLQKKGEKEQRRKIVHSLVNRGHSG